MAQISQSIGQGGYNTDVKDIQTIQHLLNKVPPLSGGPDPKLEVEGKNWGSNWDRTIEAINKFQKAKFGGSSDGRIDPGGPTFAELLKYERTFFPVEPGDISLPSDNGFDFNLDPNPSAKSTKFAIQMLGECSLGDGFIGEGASFKICDTENHLAGTFYYIGAGAGVGGGIGKAGGLFKAVRESHSVTAKIIGQIPGFTVPGPWNYFTMQKPVNVGIFQGPARFTPASAFKWGVNILHIPFVGGSNWGLYININSGWTLGIGLGTSIGFMVMEPQTLTPFYG
jgi:hypothetical protein